MEKNTDRFGDDITNEQAREFINSVTSDIVYSVYSGRPGCMCGCLGKYRYNPKHRFEAGLERGYKIDDEECSSRSISIILNKLKRNPHSALQYGYIIHFHDEHRQYAAYIKRIHALRIPSEKEPLDV